MLHRYIFFICNWFVLPAYCESRAAFCPSLWGQQMSNKCPLSYQHRGQNADNFILLALIRLFKASFQGNSIKVGRTVQKHTLQWWKPLKTHLSWLMFAWNSGQPQPHLILFDLARKFKNYIWPCWDNITELRTAVIELNWCNSTESPWPGPRTVWSKHNKF